MLMFSRTRRIDGGCIPAVVVRSRHQRALTAAPQQVAATADDQVGS